MSRLFLDVVMFALSAKVTGVGLYKSIRAWKTGGSLFRWVKAPPVTAARGYYNQAVQNPQARNALIGEYKLGSPLSYEQLAGKVYRHLNLPKALYDQFMLKFGFVADAWWYYINERFIRFTANARKPVYVTKAPNLINSGNLLREYNLLLKLGYGKGIIDPSTGFWKMTPPKP